MIQTHGKTILLMEFKFIIKVHDSNPWQFIHPKPNSHWQYQEPNFYWQHQSPIFISITLSKRKEPKIINAWQRKNIILKCYRGKKEQWQSSYEETH